jgi:UDP-glucose 4-epimerase
MRVLITGISGTIGRMVAQMLVGEDTEVYGIDRRPWPDAPSGVEMVQADIRKRKAEDVFRTKRPEVVIHMATVSHFTTGAEERYRINLRGTQTVFDHCNEYDVEHTIFVGRHTFYGAAPDAPLYHTEADPPLAVSTFPELADLVAADLFAGSALWRVPEMHTTVLRMVYTLGPSRRGTLAKFLRGPRVPTVLGFDPLYQFMHERDVASAIVAAMENRVNGVYNVAGPQPVPLSLLIEVTGRQAFPIPEPFFQTMLGKFSLPDLPEGATSHVKYPVVVDDSNFREATGFEHEFDEVQTMESFRWN